MLLISTLLAAQLAGATFPAAQPAGFKAPPEVCAVLNGGPTKSPDDRPARAARPMSKDTADTLAAFNAMRPAEGGVSDPAALALLGGLADMMAERDDPDSQAALAMLRKSAPQVSNPAVRARGRDALGCTKPAG